MSGPEASPGTPRGSAPEATTVRLHPITVERFAPFGRLIEAPAAAGRQNFPGSIASGRPDVAPLLSAAHLVAPALPLRVAEMERHVFSSQTFLPLDVSRYAVIAAPDKGGEPDLSGLAGFSVPASVGVSYHPGTWHAAMMVLDRPGRIAIILHRDGTADDCDVRPVAPFMVIE